MSQFMLRYRDRVANMSKEDQFTFLQKQGDDLLVASALLTAPPFISGLSEAEAALIRSKDRSGSRCAPKDPGAEDRDQGHGLGRAGLVGRGRLVAERGGLVQPKVRAA